MCFSFGLLNFFPPHIRDTSVVKIILTARPTLAIMVGKAKQWEETSSVVYPTPNTCT